MNGYWLDTGAYHIEVKIALLMIGCLIYIWIYLQIQAMNLWDWIARRRGW